MDNDPRISPNLTTSPGALIRLGCALVGSGKGDLAVAILRKLMAERPDDPELESAARVILSHRVPEWHRAMLGDGERNDAFETALSRSVRAGSTVLDIGTGSGLLAMMAARSGAGRVVACEADKALAETARAIVAANRLSDIVEVRGMRSTELNRERDLGGGADLVVAEIFSDNLLWEGALRTLDHAARELARPGARFIPAAASIRVALGYREISDGSGRVKGFDLSLFRRHLAPGRKLPIGDKRLRLSGPPADLFSFEFGGADLEPSGRSTLSLRAEDGEANGLVQWLRLRLDKQTCYENRPAQGRKSHWAASYYPFGEGRVLAQGEAVDIHAAHDGERLQIWFDR